MDPQGRPRRRERLLEIVMAGSNIGETACWLDLLQPPLSRDQMERQTMTVTLATHGVTLVQVAARHDPERRVDYFQLPFFTQPGFPDANGSHKLFSSLLTPPG